MATREFLLNLLNDFFLLSNRTHNEQEKEAFIQAYNVAFRGIKDSALMEAAAQYKAEGKYFPPKPSELSQYISIRSEAPGVDFRLRNSTQCQKCRTVTTCIQEPALGGPLLCRECYTGMTQKQYEHNMTMLGTVNTRKGRFALYDQATKTTKIKNTKPEKRDLLEEIIGGDEDDD